MKNWVNETLRFMRDDIYTIKKNKQEAGFQNQFNKEHQKNDISSMNRSSKSHKKTVDNYNTEITETLKRINEIMKKII